MDVIKKMDIIRLYIQVYDYYAKVRNFRKQLKETLKRNRLLKYILNVAKCVYLFRLSSDLTVEAASLQSLLFVSIFHLRTLSALSALKVLGGQIFWILTAHGLKQHFTSNAVMSILTTFDSEIATVQDELLNTHAFLLFFKLFAVDRITTCLAVSFATSLFKYLWLCKKCSDDWFLFLIWTWSFYTWFPKLTCFPVIFALVPWMWFTLVR